MANLNVNLHYPASEVYTYQTIMERINLDDERRYDISHGNGFPITSSKPIKEDVKDLNGIFSTRFGKTLNDDHPYEDLYRCRCGRFMGKSNENHICHICNTPVKFVDNNFGYFGWMVLKDEYFVIHPALFMSLASFIGLEEFDNIIKIQSKKDEDGMDIEIKRPKKEPFFGIGMMEFHDRFDEIMEYYYSVKCKTQSKIELYEDIMREKDNIFTHSIPVFTTLLRPYKIEGGEMHYESTNAIYKILSSIVAKINSDSLTMNRNRKTKNELLYDCQMKIKKLFNEINKILSGKKGSIRSLMGGRLVIGLQGMRNKFLAAYWLIAGKLMRCTKESMDTSDMTIRDFIHSFDFDHTRFTTFRICRNCATVIEIYCTGSSSYVTGEDAYGVVLEYDVDMFGSSICSITYNYVDRELKIDI